MEGRPGAGGQIGTAAVKAAPPDGSTVLLALDHSVVVAPPITPSAGHKVARFQWTFAVPQSCPAKSLPEVVEMVRKDAQKGNHGAPLTGGVPGILGEAIPPRSSTEPALMDPRSAESW